MATETDARLSQNPETAEPAAHEIGQEAYVYAYPLVTMDISRRQMTNIDAGKVTGCGPMNTFAHMREYPPAELRIVVRPNFDTLYSSGPGSELVAVPTGAFNLTMRLYAPRTEVLTGRWKPPAVKRVEADVNRQAAGT